jgi:hypothetical protein
MGFLRYDGSVEKMVLSQGYEMRWKWADNNEIPACFKVSPGIH